MNQHYLTALMALSAAYQEYVHNNGRSLTIRVVPDEIDVQPDWQASDLITQVTGEHVLKISGAHSEKSIYGLTGNVLFRTAHDLAHIKHKRGFTTQDELILAEMHWNELRDCIQGKWRPMCQAIYLADTVSQSLYFERYGEFPEDQRAFVHDILRNQGWL